MNTTVQAKINNEVLTNKGMLQSNKNLKMKQKKQKKKTNFSQSEWIQIKEKLKPSQFLKV